MQTSSASTYADQMIAAIHGILKYRRDMELMGADDYFNAVYERMVKEQLSRQSHGTN